VRYSFFTSKRDKMIAAFVLAGLLLGIAIASVFGAERYLVDAQQFNLPASLSLAPGAIRLPSISGMSLASPANSDCQFYLYSNNTLAINCPLLYYRITAAQGAHVVQPNEWGGVLVASGGGVVQIILPATSTIGRNVIGFATDGRTGFQISTTPPTIMQGSALIENGVINAEPNSTGSAGLSGGIYQIDMVPRT